MADKNRIPLDMTVDNPKLRELLGVRMAVGTSEAPDREKLLETVNEIAREMVEKALFIVPVQTSEPPVKDKDGSLSISGSAGINFLIFTLPDGDQYMPLFSDNAEYERWEQHPENIHYLTVDFAHIMRPLEDSPELKGLVLDPFSNNLIIPRANALKWYEQQQIAAQGHANHPITDASLKDVYDLKPMPFQLLNVLRETAKGMPQISSLWLRGIKFNDEDAYLLIIEFSGDRSEAFTPLGEAAVKFLDNRPLHIVPLDQGFGGKAADGVSPIYVRE